jgi:hypothetical protein
MRWQCTLKATVTSRPNPSFEPIHFLSCHIHPSHLYPLCHPYPLCLLAPLAVPDDDSYDSALDAHAYWYLVYMYDLLNLYCDCWYGWIAGCREVVWLQRREELYSIYIRISCWMEGKEGIGSFLCMSGISCCPCVHTSGIWLMPL